MAKNRIPDDLIDLALEETFPASDPPFFMGLAASERPAGKLAPIDVKAGDRVLFGKWSGTEVKIDGDEYLIMKESDIMGCSRRPDRDAGPPSSRPFREVSIRLRRIPWQRKRSDSRSTRARRCCTASRRSRTR
jgi:hypothetical protein